MYRIFCLYISSEHDFIIESVFCKGKERLADTLNVSTDEAKSFTSSFLGLYFFMNITRKELQ